VDWWPRGVEWTAITPGRPVSLDVIAAETGMDVRLLRSLNLELLHGITPADPSREMVVPANMAEEVVNLLGKDGLVLVSHHIYQVQPGDTLYELSRHYGISVAMIERQNPGLAGRYLRPGEALVIPVLNEVAPFERRPEAAGRPFNGTHVVVQGDTLWSLARAHNVSLQELATANGMDMNQTLSIGRTLKVPIIVE
jgi:membrane-bound lytic murein transglycosylase D